VLDNFEHVLDASPLAAELLAACPGLRIVVTSRSPLHVSGEHEFPLDPLPADEAVELFSQRARAVRPGFTAPPETLSRICERLEGLPLALELAAARTKVLSPDELLDRLHQRLDLLAAGPRDLPERQQTLRAAIQWSYELLHPDEQGLFLRLAVFAGGCSLESAEAVCGASLDSLASLLDKSLLRRRDLVAGSSRFWMLETIREFALEQLAASGGEPAARQAHAAYFVTFAENARARLSGAGQREALEQVDAELDNLRAALAWTYDAAPADAVRLAAALGRCWAIRGQMQEAHRWLEAIALLPEVESAPGATALLAAGNFASYAGDLEEARGFYERGQKIAQAVVPSQVPNFLVGLGQVALSGGDVPTARGHWEEGLAGARSNGDDATAALILNNLGWAAIEEDDLDAATAFLDESAEIQREIGDGANLAMMLSALAYVRFRQGNRNEGQELLCEAVTLAIESGDRPATAWCVVVAAFGEARASAAQAARLLGAAEAASLQFGVPPEQFDAKVREQASSAARGGLDEKDWHAAWDRGIQMSLEEAASIVLKSPAVDRPRRPAKGRRA
jgi:predicted ATPase